MDDTRWWLHVFIEGVGLLLAAAVAYGVVKTKIKRMETDIETLQIDMSNTMPKEECLHMQEACQEKVCAKIEDVGARTEKIIENNTRKWQQVATILGAICQKLNITLPNWNR